MKKAGIIITIVILLLISGFASVMAYYYLTNNTNDTVVDSELKEYFDKVGKKYKNIYTTENTTIKDFNFDTSKDLFMNNFILENLEFFDFSDSFDTEKYRNQSLIDNWLFVYIVDDNNIKDACFSKELLTTAYKKIFNEEVEIEKIFNDNEITNHYVCYSKKDSDIKEYKYKEAKILNTTDEDDLIVSYYELKDNKNEIHNIGISVSGSINNVYMYNDYQEKNSLETIIKDREFDKQTEVGGSYSGSGLGSVNYLKDKGTYEFENEVTMTLSNGKITFKHNNKEEILSIQNIKEVALDGESMTQSGNYNIYFITTSGELYYYNEIPYDGDDKTLKERVKNYKKISLNKNAKNFVFRRNEINEYYENPDSYNVSEVLVKLSDNTLYSIKNNKVITYLVSSNDDVNIYKNNEIEIKNKKLSYKFKSILDMENFTIWGYIEYFVTEDNYLYDVTNNKLVSSSKINNIYKSNEENCDYSYLVTFENNESVSISGYRCS